MAANASVIICAMAILTGCGKNSSTTTSTRPTIVSASSSTSAASSSTTKPAAIILQSPKFGETVTSPITLKGTADVFESMFSYELLAPSGKKLDSGNITADAMSGTPAPFTKTISTTYHGNATIVLFDLSAKDGSRIDETRTPIMISSN
jgi:hypothetical protein